MGAEIPSSSERFFSSGSCELAILAMQSRTHVKPPCNCIANAVSSSYEHREIVPTGVDFDYDGNRRGGGFWFHLRRVKGAASSPDFFCVRGTKRSFSFHGRNSRVQPLIIAHSDACSLHIPFRPVTFVSVSGGIPMECRTKPPPPPHVHSYFLLVVMTITYSPIPSLFPFFLRWG